MIVKMHKGTAMYDKDDGLVTGTVPAIPVEVDKPLITWDGAKFPRKLYLQTVAFAKWCAEQYGGEVQGRLYHSASRNQWRVAVLPQYISRNMHSEEMKAHELRAHSLRFVSDGDWVQNGTWHSHVFGMASQSPDDLANEMKQPGLHYTVGSLRAEKTTFHCRYMYRKLMYPLDEECVIHNPHVDPKKCNKFPHEWIKMLIEDTRPAKVWEREPVGTSRMITAHGMRMSEDRWKEYMVENPLPSRGWPEARYESERLSGFDEFSDSVIIERFASLYSESEELIEAFIILARKITGQCSFNGALEDFDQALESSAFADLADAQDQLDFSMCGYENMD